MNRVKDYLHNLGESIADYMDAHATIDLSSKDNIVEMHLISEACEDYSNVAQFVRDYCDEKDGSLYHREDRVPLRSELKLKQ